MRFSSIELDDSMRTLLHFFITLRAGIFILLLWPVFGHAETNLKVVTSIQPLQIITNDIMRGVDQAEVLIGPDQSPHHFQLKPSQMRRASRADLLIWISNDLEAGLKRVQQVLPEGSHKLELLPRLGLSDQHRDDDDHDHQVHSHPHDFDEHIWLSPDLLIRIAGLISEQLSKLDPAHARQYRQNSQTLSDALQQWKQRNRARLHHPQPTYILDHHFLSHFERSLALQPHDSLRDSHDSATSIRHLRQLQQSLKQHPVKCLLVAKMPPSAQARQISQQFGLKIQPIETLGHAGKDQSTIDFLDAIADALVQCR